MALVSAEPIDLDAHFVNPDAEVQMLYPGEAGDPTEDCNCHCSHWANIDDPKAAGKKAPTGAQQRAWRAKGVAEVRHSVTSAFERHAKAAIRETRSRTLGQRTVTIAQ